MNIGVMKMSAQNSVTLHQTVSTTKEGLSTFGSVFGQVISSTNNAKQTSKGDSKVEEGLAEIAALLNVKSTEELLTLLDIPQEGGLLILQVGEESKAISVDEMVNLDDLMAALNINGDELLQMVQQLLGKDKQAKDVWELLAIVDAQAPLLQSKIVSALEGKEQVTSKEMKQFLQVLKLAELVGQKTDLIAPQENALTSIKNFITTMQTQVETILAEQQVTTKTSATIPLKGFQQVIAQVSQGQQQIQQPDTDATEVVTANTVQTKLDTFQVTLPTSKLAQSEALVKEMQTIMNKMQLSNAQGVTRLTLKLYPENLGTIRIELVQNDGVLTARLLASTAHGRELLDSQANQLKQAFAQQNIQLERLDIAQALQDIDRQQRDSNFFNNFFKQQQQQEEQETKRDDEEMMSFSDFLINEEV